jgi:hypothetical protein
VDYPDRPLHRLTTAFRIFAWVLTTGRYPPFRLSQ